MYFDSKNIIFEMYLFGFINVIFSSLKLINIWLIVLKQFCYMYKYVYCMRMFIISIYDYFSLFFFF